MFDRVVVVDWSANGAPKSGADSIWIAVRDRGSASATAVNVRTRALAAEHLVDALDVRGRVLAGFDFSFGYPAGFAAAAGFDGVPWAATWAWLASSLDDDHRNRNNRFAIAAALNERLGRTHFWGAPRSRAGRWLTTTRPAWTDLHLPTYRSIETTLRAEGHRPFSGWQLLGAGAVGSQSLTGIPVLHRLGRHDRLRDRALVWPFETGLAVPDAPDAIVIAEVWPSAVAFEHVAHPVKDARQVIALADALATSAERDPTAMFAPAVPDPHTVVTEEGWVLRPGPSHRT